ncbi:MAG TPA: isoaspartyl peptidase/L-asparaginase [Pirellulaceae bacterium]|nr:isoaspartyl peptidase/L-asparaginase [Pirellulaceae bacterium]
MLRPICLVLALLVLPLAAAAQEATRKYAIILHGGAGSSSEKLTADEKRQKEESLGKALDVGIKILKDGGASLDAVEQVIRVLEDDPLFNAGRGAVFNAAGGHELDASIMDGRTNACGAVAAVRTVKNPISLSRLVMTKTRHVLLTSDGAEKFADEMKVERVDPKYFFTQRAHESWQKAKEEESKAKGNAKPGPGTVGCVALDSHGNLAAGTSTGGLTNKRFGRVGDSPVIGAGTYADNATCGVSCTGTGEEFIRHAVAFHVSARMAYLKEPVDKALHAVLTEKLKPGDGGIIALDKDGNIAAETTTAGLARAFADWRGKRVVTLGK